MAKPKVVIIGGGFGGLVAARNLRHADVDLILVDRTNHHLFQPLLYQVAVAALAPADIAVPLKYIFRRQDNIRVLLDEAVSINKQKRLVHLKSKEDLQFDYLIVAAGAQTSYFGHDNWQACAPGLKTLTNAMDIRERILLTYEMADTTPDRLERQKLLTFVVVGAGPTGVEMAGAIAEISRKALRYDFKTIREEPINVLLIDGGDRVLSSFSEKLSAKAGDALREIGVTLRLNTRVEDVTPDYVLAAGEMIQTYNVFWAAGNQAAPLLKTLETPTDNMGRAIVRPDLTIPESDNIFVIGDAANFVENGTPLPGLAPVATQQGAYVADIIKRGLPPQWRKPFAYFDKGAMATIGRAKAIAAFAGLEISGFWAWLMWAAVHVALLIHFRNRIRVMLEWFWFYITFQPGTRIIYGRKSKTPI